MDFKSVDKKYRPIPFWSWNERLTEAETARQVRLMDDAGVGGYFMHARGGLLTEYMGQEWFSNVDTAISEGRARGMHPWAYDENGWPSGFGGGKVNGLGVEYQQKSLHVEPIDTPTPHTSTALLERDGYRYYYTVNEFYVDVLSREVMAKFIEEIYCEYKRRSADGIDGFFTDEPQIWRGTGYPWSFTLPEQFSSRYGYSLVEHLDELFLDKGEFVRTRVDFWRLVTDLFSENYFKQIYDWCEENGYKFTGHLVLEEDMFMQLVANGACMPHYEYFHIPGMDWLARPVFDCLTPVQLGSVAAQMGKRQVLSETFALSGHNVSHDELKRIFEWQMVHGVTLLCTHLEGYSMRGIRKRDYPPAMYYQQPWWTDMKIFFDSMSRIGMLMSEGEVVADTLLIHPQTLAWTMYDGVELGSSSCDRIMEQNDAFVSDMRVLEDKHVLYHLGDETVMRRHAYVEDGCIVIGKMRYSKLILPRTYHFMPETVKLIDEYIASGGAVVTVEDIEPRAVTGINKLTYTMRRADGYDVHYFVNSTDSEITAEISVGNKYLDITSGELFDFSGTHTFGAYESLVLIDTHAPRVTKEGQKRLPHLDLSGEWQVKRATPNSLTLDTCDYYFDGTLIERDGYVLNILPRINERRRPTQLRQVYRFYAEHVPDSISLAIETPELFSITLNGRAVDTTPCGYFRDLSWKTLELCGVRLGENVIEITSTVTQSENTYKHLDNSWTFEAMKNCLSYDMEIEPIYLVGDFGVRACGTYEELELDSYRTCNFVICAPSERVDIRTLDRCGFPEFSGELTLRRRFKAESCDMAICPKLHGANAVRISVNGKSVATKMFGPYTTDLSDYLVVGENEIELTIVNNLRNNQGPHHLELGECLAVCPHSFYKESNIFRHEDGADEACHDVLDGWNDMYCLVHFGVEFI